MWEIIIMGEEVFVVNYSQDFSHLYAGQVNELKKKKNLRFINLAANKEWLILNHDYSDSFDVVMFCRVD